MNYRHHFHAGNFADVMKHALLIELVRAMQRKPKGCLFLDTHAGSGAYDLSGAGMGTPSRGSRSTPMGSAGSGAGPGCRRFWPTTWALSAPLMRPAGKPNRPPGKQRGRASTRAPPGSSGRSPGRRIGSSYANGTPGSARPCG